VQRQRPQNARVLRGVMRPNPSLEPTRYGIRCLAASGPFGSILARPSSSCLRRSAQLER
jgi:hypothetical protein